MTPSYLSLYILADGCVEADINRAGRFLAACECEYYTLVTAARYNESEKIIRTLHNQAPKARAIWRGWDKDILNDGSIWQRVKPQEWVNYRIAPNARWINELGVITLTCNEVGTLGQDTRDYAGWEADSIRLSSIQFDAQLAVLRLSTGNPLESEQENYKAALQAASEYDAILSFNEYTSTRMEITNKYHVGRYRWAWAQQDKMGIKRSKIVIGEYGIAKVNGDKSLDPYNGAGAIGVNTADYVSVIKRDGAMTYQQDGVTVGLFTFGHWQEGKGSFDVHQNEPLLSAIETEAKLGNLSLKPAEPPTLPVAIKDVQRGEQYRLISRGKLIDVYAMPPTSPASTRIIATMPDNVAVEVYNKATIDSGKWFQIKHPTFDGLGWINVDLIDIRQTVTIPAVIVPPEVPAVKPDEPPIETPKVTVIDARSRDAKIIEQLKVLRGAIDTIISLYESAPITA